MFLVAMWAFLSLLNGGLGITYAQANNWTAASGHFTAALACLVAAFACERWHTWQVLAHMPPGGALVRVDVADSGAVHVKVRKGVPPAVLVAMLRQLADSFESGDGKVRPVDPEEWL